MKRSRSLSSETPPGNRGASSTTDPGPPTEPDDDDDVEEVVSISEDSDSDTWHGLDDQSRRTLALALGVGFRVTPIETLAYTLLCKSRRGDKIGKDDLLELWDALPRKFRLKDRTTPSAAMCVFGANPRQTGQFTCASRSLPHVFELLQEFMKQIAPDFKWSTLCIRQNCSRGPHRDTRNIGMSLVLALTSHSQGGGLWVFDPTGQHQQIHNGQVLAGRVQALDQPFQFAARTTLHATQPWSESRRVILVAFTPIGSLSLQNPVPSQTRRQTRIHDFFGSLNFVA